MVIINFKEDNVPYGDEPLTETMLFKTQKSEPDIEKFARLVEVIKEGCDTGDNFVIAEKFKVSRYFTGYEDSGWNEKIKKIVLFLTKDFYGENTIKLIDTLVISATIN